jgi:Fe-S cluster assembly iron-binding protein IscA
MQLKKCSVAALAVCSLLVAGAAQAGPTIRVTVKNLGSATVKYTFQGNNEALTHANATPKPADTINPQQAITFEVRDQRNPAIATAVVRYGADGKDAQATGRVRCNATITAINASDHSWNIEFTIQ